MEKITIKTNNHKIPLLSGYELNDKERTELYYIDDFNECTYQFFRYKDYIYDVLEFMTTSSMPADNLLRAWDGYRSDSFFSGIVIKYVNDYEFVKVGTYFS